MGNTANCCSSEAYPAIEIDPNDTSRLELGQFEILEFERRVKKFAHPINKGKVTLDQLFEAFRDTNAFVQLRNPYSLVTKLLLSPFFQEIPLSHYEKDDETLMHD